MLDRRRFLKAVAAAASMPAAAHGQMSGTQLVGDPGGILDLPPGFGHTIVSRAGEPMLDGFRVPVAHDGMAAFPGDDGRFFLVCNHEVKPAMLSGGAFGDGYSSLSEAVLERLYDRGGGATPGPGGTTTAVYDPATRKTERQFLSLGGTEINCAGGPTPWGSWLSCEECFASPGTTLLPFPGYTRDERHGYVFEVPARAAGLVEAVPIRAMGRFEHEACAVHEPTGIVYMTEDRRHGLFYRYLPDIPGKLARGGRLQALAMVDRSAQTTHNWSSTPDLAPNRRHRTRWIDLDDVDPEQNDLRLRGAAQGAATFARGEGLTVAGDRFAFTCTIGGPARLGQVFTYRPSPFEGTAREGEDPGVLSLIAEADGASLLRNADNLTMAPWGDLIVCEDTSEHCGLVGIRPDGRQYAIADNPYSNSELAGACFSPDGEILFVNIQYPGMTLAITGPWESLYRL